MEVYTVHLKRYNAKASQSRERGPSHPVISTILVAESAGGVEIEDSFKLRFAVPPTKRAQEQQSQRVTDGEGMGDEANRSTWMIAG